MPIGFEALEQRGIKPCIPSKAYRKIQIPYDKAVDVAP